MDQRPEMAAQVARIQAEIAQDGESVVGCEELKILCPEVVPLVHQFSQVAMVAVKHGWSFEFRADGSVRFADL